LLVREGVVAASDVETAVALQDSLRRPLGQLLVRMGALEEGDLLAALSRQLALSVQDPKTLPPPNLVGGFIAETGASLRWWRERPALAWRTPGEAKVVCVASDPFDGLLRQMVEQTVDGPIEWRLGARADLEALLDSVEATGDLIIRASPDAVRLRELAQETPVIDFVNAVFAEAQRRRASDVHFEPFETRYVVRLRIDGVLEEIRRGPRAGFDAICSRLKLLSGMDIGERRLPQDGRQTVRVSGQEMDLRVSTLPANWGESLVVRLLGRSDGLPELAELGLTTAEAARLEALVDQPNGVVLVTGPTGSGKTTTIYRLLARLNDGGRKILTIEDPVEFDLPGVVQMRVRGDIGLNFAVGLRSILRQDPDIIMVGEIRDAETARIAVQAALTGHLVIATVHTNSAIAAVARLLDLGIEDYLLADVLRGLVGQRLVRRLCDACARSAPPRVAEGWEGLAKRRGLVATAPPAWREPVACDRCSGGFTGRVGLFEIVAFTPELAELVRNHAGEGALTQAARARGFVPLLDDGLTKARSGHTTLAEVHRVIGVDVGDPPGGGEP
jgi:general secretion pathway protein E